MELLLLFLGLTIAAGLVVWWSATTTRYRIKNRDIRAHYTSRPKREREGPDWSEMLD